MKRLKVAISLMLCLVLALVLFAGCKGNGNDDLGEVVYGRYVETDISPGEMNGYPMAFAAFDGGVLDMIAVNYGTAAENYKASYQRWRSSDNGETWQSVDMSWTEEYIHDYSEYYDKGEQPPEEVYLGTITPFANGDVLANVTTYKNDPVNEIYESTNELFTLSTSGEKKPFSLPEIDALIAEGKSPSMNDVRVLPGNRLMVYYYVNPTPEEQADPSFDYSSTERRAVYDLNTGEKLYDISFNGWDYLYNDTTLYLNDYEKGYQAINLADGSPSNAPMPKAELMSRLSGNYSGGSAYVDNDGNFYNVNARGMEKITPDSEAPEQVMDGLNYTYGSPLYGINNMVYNAESDSLLMAVYDSYNYEDRSVKLLRYEWDDEAIASSDKKVRVYSLYDNYSVRLALSEFKRQNPDVTIEFETAFAPEGDESIGMGSVVSSTYRGGVPAEGEDSGGETGMTEEDALRALNTELLNGTGPDVLILDGLPLESFIEKGVLEDLSDVVGANSDLMKPLFDTMTTDGKIYAVPTNFFVPTLMGEKGYVEQFTSLETLLSAIRDGAGVPQQKEWDPTWTPEEEEAYYQEMWGPKPAEQQPVLYFESPRDVFESFYASSAPAIFSEKGGIDQQSLKTFLEGIKEVYDKYDIGENGYTDDAYYSGGSMSMGYASYEFSMTMNRFGQRQSRLGYSQLGSFNILDNVASSLHWSGQPQDMGKGVIAEPVPVDGDVDVETEGTDDVTDDAAASVPEADAAATGGAGITATPVSANFGPASSESLPSSSEDADAPVPESDEPATLPTDPAADPAGEGEGDTPAGEALPDVDATTIVAPGLAEGTFIPVQMVGVTTTSKNVDLAKAFVAAYLSEEVQKYDMGNGFPVSSAAIKTQHDRYVKNYTEEGSYYLEEGVKYIPYDYEAVISSLKTPLYNNAFLKDTIYKPVGEFLRGSKSLDETVQQVVSETELYFAERQ